VRFLGKGIDKIYGVIGGVIALLAIVAGNFLGAIAFVANYSGRSFLDTLINFNYALTFDLLAATFSLMNLLFFGFAVYEGYQFAFRKVSREKLLAGIVTPAPPPGTTL